MTSPSSDATTSADREIVLSRVFDAPRELLWKVWTDPKHVPNWWGPLGFTTTTQKMEVKAGGTWRFVMHGPDGRDYQNQITYLEVQPPERLTYKHGGDTDGEPGCEPVNFTVTVTFAAEGDGGKKTRLTMRSVFPSANAREFVIKQYNALEGGKQHLARLGEYLQQVGQQASGAAASSANESNAADRPFTIARVLNAPRDLVWSVWTAREHLMHWFGPKGVTIPQCTLDLRPGGTFHYAMRTPDGNTMWGKWVFREIVPMERLVFTLSFADENGGVTRHPMSPEWPLEMLSTVTFAHHAGIGRGTLVTVQMSALNPTAPERKVFHDGHSSMQQGWTGTFEQLVEYLAKAKV